MREIEAILSALGSSLGHAGALATLVAVEGSSYRRTGARMLVIPGRQRVGSISGGCLEGDIALRAKTVLRTGRSDLAVYDTTNENDLIWGSGTGCRGIVRILIERIPINRPTWLETLETNLRVRSCTELAIGYGGSDAFQGTYLASNLPALPAGGSVYSETIAPPPALILFGAGEDARPLCRLAKEVGMCVTVVDSRAAYAAPWRFPEADAVVVAPSESLDEHVELNADSHVVVMTHRYEEDLKLLGIILRRPAAYVGIVGSRQRTQRLLAQIREEGAVLDRLALAALSAPVGLDIGATTPETIALSILAELQCVMTGRNSSRLRERITPIHENHG